MIISDYVCGNIHISPIKSTLFSELAEKKYLLKTKDGKPTSTAGCPTPLIKHYPHLQPSGIIDFTNPDAYQWYLEAHKPLFDIGVSVMKTDYGESIPEDVVAHNGDTGKRLHNVYSLLYNQCVYEATGNHSSDGGDGLGTGRLGRQPAIPNAMGRRSPDRLGGSSCQHPRRAYPMA